MKSKRLHLMTALALLLAAGTAGAQTVTYDTAAGTGQTMSFTTTAANGALADATAITVSGEWTDDQWQNLRAALKSNGVITTANAALQTADMSAATGAFSSMIYMFQNCTALTSVTLPKGTSYTDTFGINFYSAFYNCEKLASVTNLDRFTNVSNFGNAFYGCKALTSVTLPVAGTTVASGISFNYAFYNCEKLASVTNLDKFANVSNFSYAFYGCKALTSVTLPVAGTTVASGIGFNNAFYGCTKLESVTNLDKFTNVSNFNSAFRNCEALTSVTLPETGTTVADGISFSYAFYGCTNLASLTNLGAFTNVSSFSYAFNGCAALTSVTLPEGTSYTGTSGISFTSAFDGCTKLESLMNLGAFTNVSSFSSAFNGCAALTSVTLPAETSYTSGIGFHYAFSGCTKLASVTNLDTFTNVSSFNYAFYNCKALTHVKFGTLGTDINANPFTGTNPNCLKYLPAGTTEVPSGWTNCIADGKALTDITLADGTSTAKAPFLCPEAFELDGKTAIYTRTMAAADYANGKQGWSTVCVPFAAMLYAADDAQTPYANATDQTGTYWLKALTGSTGEGQLTFGYATSIEANTPYLIALPGSGMDNNMSGKKITFRATGVTVPATPDDLLIMAGNYAFAGTYAPVLEQPMYLLTRGTGDSPDYFALYTEGNLAPFRACIKDNTGANRAPRLVIGGDDDGGATGIRQVQAGEAAQALPAVTRIYGIDGRLVKTVPSTEYESAMNALPHGVYIVNGKKTVK